MFIDPRPASPNLTVRMRCDVCNAEYNGKPKTADRQFAKEGKHFCPHCMHVLTGKRVGDSQREKLRESMKGNNNPAKRMDVRESISKSLKGIKFSEEHKNKLRKPKSNTVKIKEAANRECERKRRQDRMIKRLRNEQQQPYGMFRNCDVGLVFTDKTPNEIWCRSGAEKKFVINLSLLTKVVMIKSAETLELDYIYNNKHFIYLPDFHVTLSDGQEWIVEIKSSYLRNRSITLAKEKALIDYCQSCKKQCVTITEEEIDSWLEKLASL